MVELREDGDSVTVDILVQPRASRSRIGPEHGDRLKVAVTAPPVEGAANKAVVDLFAKALGCARGDVEVIRGQSSRRKTVRIRNVRAPAIRELW